MEKKKCLSIAVAVVTFILGLGVIAPLNAGDETAPGSDSGGKTYTVPGEEGGTGKAPTYETIVTVNRSDVIGNAKKGYKCLPYKGAGVTKGVPCLPLDEAVSDDEDVTTFKGGALYVDVKTGTLYIDERMAEATDPARIHKAHKARDAGESLRGGGLPPIPEESK